MSFPRYESYRDSGVEWIGSIPSHWKARRLRQIAKLESGHTPSRQRPEYWVEDECVIPWFTLTDIGQFRDGTRFRITKTSQRISEIGMANSAARLLPRGTVVLSRTASVGFSAISEIEMAVSQDFAAWICGPSLRPRYLLYALRAMRPEFDRLMMGSTHQTIYMPDIEALKVPVPELAEQDRVIAFLDRETAKIDALVEEQRRLIELLVEKRQAFITHAVTMGLDPSAPMKPSGVEWLGEVPAHWRVERLKRLCDVRPSNVDKKSYEDELPVQLCNYIDVYYNDRITSVLDFMQATASEEQIARFSLKKDDVIITKDSETSDDIAIAAYVPADLEGVVCGYHLALLRPSTKAHGGFIKWFLGSWYAKSCFAVRSNGLTRMGLSQYAIDNVEVPTPPPREQEVVAAFLDRETAKIDALVEEQRRLIELLGERRAALISAAVTGKIDVRGLRSKAPKAQAA